MRSPGAGLGVRWWTVPLAVVVVLALHFIERVRAHRNGAKR